MAYPVDAFTDEATVVDQFAPFLWNGPGAPRIWWTTLLGGTPEAHERSRALREHIEMMPVAFAQVTGDKAYVVMPWRLTWFVRNERHEMTATWVATESLTLRGWLISSHARAPLDEKVTPQK